MTCAAGSSSSVAESSRLSISTSSGLSNGRGVLTDCSTGASTSESATASPAGVCAGRDLIDAYHAMDLFAFASHSETQGMVLTEAMAAGKPVVALDGPGVRDVVQDRLNGRLIALEHRQLFVHALIWVASLPPQQRAALSAACDIPFERTWAFRIAHGTRLTLRVERQDDGRPWGEIIEIAQP